MGEVETETELYRPIQGKAETNCPEHITTDLHFLPPFFIFHFPYMNKLIIVM